MSSRKDAGQLLAERMLQVLHEQRHLGADAYPLSVKRLAELADAQASTVHICKALRKRFFRQQAALVHIKNTEAPIALADDVNLLAGDRKALEFALQLARTPATQAFSVSQLKAKLTGKFQKSFQTAVNGQIDQGTLPPTVGWITISRSKKLFLLADVHTSSQATQQPTPAVSEPAPAQPTNGVASFEEAFLQLDRQRGGHNFVNLIDLRRAWPVNREQFDAELRQQRLAGRYSLSAAEGRHGISPEEQAAGILEDGALLLYVSRKSP
jgi:hypothetical protein